MPRQRYQFSASLSLLSPLHVGFGEFRRIDAVKGKKGEPPQQIAAILRDLGGKPYIPGSTIKGLFRRIAETLPGQPDPSRIRALFGEAKNDNERGAMGALMFRGTSVRPAGDADEAPYARAAKADVGPGVFVAARTRIDDAIGVASEHHLFHQEMVAPGATFDLTVVLEADAENIEAMARVVLRIFDRLAAPWGECVGKGQADGFGRVHLPTRGPHFKKTELKATGWAGIASDLRLESGNANAAGEWSFELFCEGPFAVLDSSRAAKRGSISDDGSVPQLAAQRSRPNLPMLLGSSLSGALRARARWLAALEFGEEDNPDILFSDAAHLTRVERLFGVNGFRGRLEIRDLTVDEATPWNVTSVKLDRFSGGHIDNALFATETFRGVRIRFTLGLSPRGAKVADASDRELIGELVDDIRRNGLVLGHGGNKGFGWFEAVER